ncbi:hypothetical protein D4Q80_03680 [bacterium]|nr:MAG: hypothetical protein D4Q80_03680 [bacterium]
MLDYILYRVGQFIALNLPLKAGYAIAQGISDLRYIFAFRDREAVSGNLKAIFPEKSEREIRRIRIRVFRNFAKYLVDFFRFSKITRDEVKKYIGIENSHYFDEALKKGKGVVVLSAHLGNWELGGAVVGLLGYPLWVVVLPHKDKKVDEFFNRQRESKGVKIIPLGKAARQCFRVLRNNELLGLVGDKDFSDKGVVLDFFGRPALFPQGPAELALKTGAIIVPAFVVRNGDDSCTLKIGNPIEFSPAGSPDDLPNLMRRYITIIEEVIKKYPEQWYMFRRFWL